MLGDYMHISRLLMHIAGECVYIYVYIYIWNSFILQANTYISSQFIHIAGEYLYI